MKASLLQRTGKHSDLVCACVNGGYLCNLGVIAGYVFHACIWAKFVCRS